MKLFIASDIHGSSYYTKLLLDRYRAENADRLVLLGDILYHGPRNDLPREYAPKEVIAMLNGIADKILAVRGNCEAEVDGMVLDFNVSSDFITLFDGETVMVASHGHRSLPPLRNGEILLVGHTHVPVLEKEDGYIRINPGSVSIPKEDSPNGYMTYEDGVFRWFDLESAECYMEYNVKTGL
ncbi:MAG: phosphodiesterase [Clostridia bacterium]|nr:phosphodiesterase [Clostridia bacterium]